MTGVEVIDEQVYDVSGLLADFDSNREAAEIFGVSERTIYTWVTKGVSWSTADRIACRMNLNPCSVWPDQWGNVEFLHEEEQGVLFDGR